MLVKYKRFSFGLALSFGLLGLCFGGSRMLRTEKPALQNEGLPAKVISAIEASTGEVKQGNRLFEHSCGPCHGDDARGDEGPSLYDLAKSDARIAYLIKTGIKGEMPAFAKKFSDAEIQSLIAYLRTLKN